MQATVVLADDARVGIKEVRSSDMTPLVIEDWPIGQRRRSPASKTHVSRIQVSRGDQLSSLARGNALLRSGIPVQPECLDA